MDLDLKFPLKEHKPFDFKATKLTHWNFYVKAKKHLHILRLRIFENSFRNLIPYIESS